jgi:hypothetical protein
MLTVQPQIRWVLMPDGRVVVNRDLRTPERIGQPLHVVGLDGNIDRSFGSETGLLRPDVPGLTTRSLAVASGSAVWAAHAHTYRLELFDISSGRELMRLTREADWFPDNERPTTQRPSSSTPPYARVAALHHSSDGLLWVLSAVPDSRWRTAVRSGEGGHAIITDPVRYYDWIIEVFDIKRGRLVISTRFDSHPPWFIGDGYAAQYREVDDDAYFSVFRVRLIGR